MRRFRLSAATVLLSIASACARCACDTAIVLTDPDGGAGNARFDFPDPDAGATAADGGNTAAHVGPGDWNPTPQNSDGVTRDPNGNLILSSSNIRTDYAWIAIHSWGMVSKIDTRTGKEVGRYWSVIPMDGQANAIALRPGAANGPSRTAVDLNGDVFVANRAAGIQGSVTKIANAESGCLDRNRDGRIRTSRDVDGNGVIDPNEMIPARDGSGSPIGNLTDPLAYDECLLWTQPVGATGGDIAARAIVIDQGGPEGGAGNVWVGIWRESRFYKLENATGRLLPVYSGGPTSVSIPFPAYGAVIDGRGRLWAVSAGSGHLTMIDTLTGRADGRDRYPTQFPCVGSYGVGVDGKHRVWLPGWTCGAFAFRYDPEANGGAGEWARFDFSSVRGPSGQPFGRPRGIAADNRGYVWMSADYEPTRGGVTHLVAFAQEAAGAGPTFTPTLKRFTHPTRGTMDFVDATTDPADVSWSAQYAIGVGLDSDGNAWINAASGRAVGVVRDTGVLIKSPPLHSGLYTYSDFTGYALRNFTAPRGWYRSLFKGCAVGGEDTRWLTVSFTADTAVCANGTKCKIQVFVRAASTLAGLTHPATTRFGPFEQSPVDLQAAGVPRAHYLEVETVLLSLDRQTSPVLKSVDVTWDCTPVFK